MCVCTSDIADATIASTMGARGSVGSTNALAGCGGVSTAGAIAVASGTSGIAPSTGATRTTTAAPSVPTSASDNDLPPVYGGTIGRRKGTGDIVSRTCVPRWSTTLLDRRSSLMGGPTRTIRGGTIAPMDGIIDSVACTSGAEGDTGEATMATKSPSAATNSASAATNDLMCPQIENTADPGEVREQAATVLCRLIRPPERSSRCPPHPAPGFVAIRRSFGVTDASLNPIHAALPTTWRENATRHARMIRSSP